VRKRRRGKDAKEKSESCKLEGKGKIGARPIKKRLVDGEKEGGAQPDWEGDHRRFFMFCSLKVSKPAVWGR